MPFSKRSLPESWLVPRASFPCTALMTSRHFAQDSRFNLALHVKDDPAHVRVCRALLAACLPHDCAVPIYVSQVHGTHIHHAQLKDVTSLDQADLIVADGLITQTRNLPLVIMTADCLPIVMADQQSRALAIIHAGWRGLASGIIQKALFEFKQIGCAPEQIHIWIGAAISQERFEVGSDVLAAFLESDQLSDARVNAYFRAISSDKYLADLSGLACEILKQSGVPTQQIECAQICTFENTDFFSHRRDGAKADVFCGRMATIAWL